MARETVHYQAGHEDVTACGKPTKWTKWDAPAPSRSHKIASNWRDVTHPRCLEHMPAMVRVEMWCEDMVRPRGEGVPG